MMKGSSQMGEDERDESRPPYEGFRYAKARESKQVRKRSGMTRLHCTSSEAGQIWVSEIHLRVIVAAVGGGGQRNCLTWVVHITEGDAERWANTCLCLAFRIQAGKAPQDLLRRLGKAVRQATFALTLREEVLGIASIGSLG